MTSVLPEEESKAARLKQKLMNDGHVKEETRSFLSFSRENLSISHSDLEQGFNRRRFRPSRNTILSAASLLVALICLGLQAWRVHCTFANSREIEALKKDVESLKHRFLEEDLLDELKAFEEQLYAEESNDEDDPGEADIENADYDSNYEDDVSSSHDYSGDYHTPPTYGSRPSDFPEASSTIQPVPSPPDPSSSKALVEFLATLRKVEAKRGQEFEKNVREGHKNIERERLLEEHKKRAAHEGKAKETNATRHRRELRENPASNSERATLVLRTVNARERFQRKRSADGEALRDSEETISASSPATNRRAPRNQTRRTIVSKLRTLESLEDELSRRNENASINGWDRHPPKKYYAHTRPDAGQPLLSAHRDDSNGQIARTNKRLNEGVDGNQSRGFNWRNEQQDAPHELAELQRATQNTEGTPKQLRRGMTRRHLRAPRQVYAVHYGADSTLFSEEDEHTGNGRAKHGNGVFKAWRPSDWVGDLGFDRYFTLADGRLTVHEPGLYLVYAQIHYLDEHDENGFHLLVNGRPILQCMLYSPGMGHKSRSCFSAQVTLLQAGDRLVLKDVASARYTLFQRDKSFFGVAKLGEPRQQQRHQPQPT